MALAEHPHCLDVVVFMRTIYYQVFMRAMEFSRATPGDIRLLFRKVMEKRYARKVVVQIHPDKAGPGTWPFTGCRVTPQVQGRPPPGIAAETQDPKAKLSAALQLLHEHQR